VPLAVVLRTGGKFLCRCQYVGLVEEAPKAEPLLTVNQLPGTNTKSDKPSLTLSQGCFNISLRI
jgi:hypothetical protein